MEINVSIVKATDDMCRDIALVKRQVWETTYRGIYPDGKIDGFDVEREAEKFARLVDDDEINLYVAMVDGNIVGYMAYGKNPRFPQSNDNELVLLNVLKECQGKGIGKMMFNFAKDRLKEKGDKFLIYCNKYNKRAQDFYKAMGCEVLSVDDDNPDRSIPQIKYICRI
jgi:ribosomal protein S18 acetylase RimI-like enzyme